MPPKDLHAIALRKRPSPEAGDPMHALIGESPAMREVKTTLRKLAQRGDSTVLVTGESGTGKDLAAKVIHGASPRAPHPFMHVTCTALPNALLESELFGHERGAFTDAKARREGLLQRAEGGTVFLDEIGDMDASLQAKLLRVLEEKRYRPIGSSDDRHANVRLIAATHVDLRNAVREGRFREDLYYRLAVLLLRMPPLRERPQDVALLVEHFVVRSCEAAGRAPCRITDKAMDTLRAYDWPGNVRELRNVIERAVILDDDDWLDHDDLQFFDPHVTPAQEVALPPDGLSIAAVERELVEQALRRANGNLSQAARLLGMSRDQIRYRIRKFNLRANRTPPQR